MSYDNVCKFLAEQYPADFVQWLLEEDVSDIQLLKTELSQEPIRADSVTFLKANHQILHLEFQTLPESRPPLPFRMLDYSVRLKRQYNCDVEQVVLFLKETNSEIVKLESYKDRTTSHVYRVIRLWEQSPSPFLANPSLLPFATLTHSSTPSALLQEVAARIATIEDNQKRLNVASCTEILAGLRFDKTLIRLLFREEVMRESVIYQDILQQGLQEGRQQGLQQGLQQGQSQEALVLIMRLLNRRFGELAVSLQEQVKALPLEKLEDLGEALLDFSEEADLVDWLQQDDRK